MGYILTILKMAIGDVIDGKSRDRKSIFYGITTTIFLLGLASFLNDIGSEMITPLLPLFITSLGGGGLLVGLIGGLGDSIVSFSKIFSGYYSDRMGRRKPIVVTGYAFSSFAKILMAFATSAWHLVLLRPVERMGKGIREPPRDAIVAKYRKHLRGKLYGFIRSMDRAGAILGSVLVLWFLTMNFSYKKIFLIAGFVAVISVIAIMFIKDVKTRKFRQGLWSGLKDLPREFRTVLWISTVFAIADFNYAFYILKAQDYFPTIFIPVALYVLSNVVFATLAWPLGTLSDRIGRKKVLIAGYFLFILSAVSFMHSTNLAWFAVSFSIYGMSYALLISNQVAFASDFAPRKELGTAMGTFQTFIAIAALPSSLMAGYLWQYVGHNYAFIFGAFFAFIAMVMLIFSRNLDGN